MSKKSPEEGTAYHDPNGKNCQVVGKAKNWRTREDLIILSISGEKEMCAVSAADFAKEFKEICESSRESFLSEFLDAMSDEDKLSIIQKRRTEITAEFLDAAAQSMDFILNGEDLESSMQDFENYLRTKIRYERKRM